MQQAEQGMGIDQLGAQNTMFPQSQMVRSYYSSPSQQPTGAVMPNQSSPVQRFDDGGDVSAAPTDPTFGNPDLANLVSIDPATAQQLNALKASNPKAYNDQLMNAVANQLTSNYRTNTNYDAVGKQFNALQSADPQQWYRNQLAFLGNQVGWQQGQNTSGNISKIQPQIDQTIADAQKAGLTPDEINSIMSGSTRQANLTNQQRIANEAASGGGMFSGIAGLAMPAADLVALGTGQAWALPFINAGISAANGADPTKIAETAALSYALPEIAQGLPTDVAQGLQGFNTAKNIYAATQNPNNIGADINAAKGITTLTAAQGGLMSGGGISNLGSYSDGGRLLKGPGDGMSDHIPAKIGKHQPARLADGEFVIPADVVSHLGNGSTDAGAKVLYKMLDRIRKARTGNPKQGKQINPNKFIPKG